MTQLRIPAVYMRGGTSKGVFFLAEHLPADPAARDALLLRAIGSPDPYRQHIDGLGGATSSTSKVVILSRSARTDSDVDYRFGQVAIDRPVIDWSGNCGNLSAAVGPMAISAGLVDAPPGGWTQSVAPVRIWQANIGRRILAEVPMADGQVMEEGEFMLDGVAFAAAEVRLRFLDPAGAADQTFPTGRAMETLQVPGLGAVAATLIDAGNPTVFVDAAALGLSGTEGQREVNAHADLLQRAEILRSHAAVAMGLAATPGAATAERPHTPKLAFVAAPADYTAADGRAVRAADIDLLARTFSMGLLHHAMTGTGAVAIAAAAAIPGTLVRRIAATDGQGRVRFGHPSGVLAVGASVRPEPGGWRITEVAMSRSARCLMEGWVRVPAPASAPA